MAAFVLARVVALLSFLVQTGAISFPRRLNTEATKAGSSGRADVEMAKAGSGFSVAAEIESTVLGKAQEVGGLSQVALTPEAPQQPDTAAMPDFDDEPVPDATSLLQEELHLERRKSVRLFCDERGCTRAEHNEL
mmetsp:Transcript_82046/g.190570  ORF Transcript_82046/g.190570 Transcript_82046/m.190570 type:complete len:135 (-) Transcript_82046:94-498(-)